MSTNAIANNGNNYVSFEDTCKQIYYTITDTVINVGQIAFRVLGESRLDLSTFGRVLRLTNFVALGIEHFADKPGLFKPFSLRCLDTDGYLDTANFGDSLHYIFTGLWKTDNIVSILGNVCFFVAGGAGLFLFADEMSLLNLEALAAGLGDIPALAFIIMNLGDFALIGIGAAYLCFGICSFRDLINAETTEEGIVAFLKTAWCAAEVGNKVFVLAGGASNIPLRFFIGGGAALVGIIAYSTEILLKTSKESNAAFELTNQKL